MRKLMWFTIGFGAACAFGAYFYVPWLWAAAAVSFLATILLLFGMRWYRPLRIGAAIFLGISIGLGWFLGYDRVYLGAARSADEGIHSVTIAVSDYSFETSYGCGFDGEVELEGSVYRVRAYLNVIEQLAPGDAVTGTFSIRLTTIGAAEEPTYHQGKGILLIAYQDGEYAITDADKVRLRDYPAIWRQKLIGIIDTALPEDVAGFAKALLLGDRSDIDYEINTAFKVTGISHIIAVSGLHVSILFGFIYLVTGRRNVLTALLGIPAVIIFAAITGFAPSVVRAGIMQILVMLAMLLDREYDPPTALAFAALMMLAVNPLGITSVSFQLSVGCMAGIFLFSERIHSYLMDKKRLGRWNNRLTRWFAGSISITLSAMVFTTPLVAVYFGAVSLIGIATNLLTLWVVTYIFYGGMLVCAAGCLHMPAASIIGRLIAWPIRFVLQVAGTLSEVPQAAVYTKSVYIVIWLVFCYALLAVFLFMKKKQPMLFGGAAVIGLCLALACSWAEPLMDECRVTALDVGQGQCILLQSQGKSFLVDCGGSYGEDAADIASEMLLSQGIHRLDGMILTHYDTDHVGGAEYLLTRIDADALYLPFTQDEDGIGEMLSQRCKGAVYVSDDLELTLGDTKLVIFAPVSYESGNESSMSVLFRTKNCDILITGDRGVATERILVQRYDLPQLDVLVVGHHGSKSSTCEELLAETRPEYAIISVGENNPYGHPAQEVIDRLEKYDCVILRTDLYGTILFRR